MKPKCNTKLYCQFLLAAQNNFTNTEMAEHLSQVEHDSITRWLSTTKLPPSLVWEQAKPLVNPKEGYLILDNSVLAKPKSDKLALAAWQYSGTRHALVKGVGLVTLLWTEHDEHIPIDFRIYAKTQDGYTKNQHFQEMLRLAGYRGFHPQAVLFDTWYASQNNINQIQELGWTWITQLRKNRVVNYTKHLEPIS